MDALNDHPRYSFVNNIGQGGNGRVILARDSVRDELVAIKLLDKHKYSEYVKREVICHRKLGKHPFIVQFKEVFFTKTHFCIVMEYINGVTLLNWLQASGALPENEARILFQQVMIAVDYIHRKGVIHRDLKLENTVVIDTTDPHTAKRVVQPKLIDFGFARGEWDSAPRSIVGTITYVAPEVLQCGNNRPYDGKADVWSLGVMLYELLLGINPFVTPDEVRTLTNQQITVVAHQRIVSAVVNYPQQPVLSEGCRQLLSRMLTSAEHRIAVADVLADPWFCEGIPEGVDIAAYNSRLVADTEFDDMQPLAIVEQFCNQAAIEAINAPHETYDYDPYEDEMNDLIDNEITATREATISAA